MNPNDTAFRAAQRHYDNLTPEPPVDEQPYPEETNGRFLRLKRKQLHIGLAAMSRELDLLPSYLQALEHRDLAWPEGLELRYDRALVTLSTFDVSDNNL